MENSATQKGIAAQLCDGVKKYDAMVDTIYLTVRIIYDALLIDHLGNKEIDTKFDLTSRNGDTYHWIITNKGLYGLFLLSCKKVINLPESKPVLRECITIANTNITDNFEGGSIRDIYDSLNDFVSEVFIRFPDLKEILKGTLQEGV